MKKTILKILEENHVIVKNVMVLDYPQNIKDCHTKGETI